MARRDQPEARYSEYLELDLSTVVPSHRRPEAPAGPRHPRRTPSRRFREALPDYVRTTRADAGVGARVFPASGPLAAGQRRRHQRRHKPGDEGDGIGRPSRKITVTTPEGATFEIDHGAVSIAVDHLVHQHLEPVGDDRPRPCSPRTPSRRACPSRPGSRPRWRRARRWSPTTTTRPACGPTWRSSASTSSATAARPASATPGPLNDEICAGGQGQRPRRGLGALGQPQLRGPDQPRRQDELPGDPAAGRRLRARRHDGLRLRHRAAGHRHRRQRRLPQGHLARPEPRSSEIIASAHQQGDVHRRLRRRLRRRRALAVAADPGGRHLRLGRRLDLRAQAPVLRRHAGSTRRRSPTSPAPGCCAKLGDSVTTDHISPAGSIKADSPAGKYLAEHGVERKDFNSYGSRRGNHEVMIRGTFANIRLQQPAASTASRAASPATSLADGEQATIYDASAAYQEAGIPLVDPRRQGVRLRLLARLGRQGHRAAGRAAPSSPSPTSASTAPT